MSVFPPTARSKPPGLTPEPEDDAAKLRAVERQIEIGKIARFPAWLEAQMEVETRVRLSNRLRFMSVRAIFLYNAFLCCDLTLTPDQFGLAVVLHLFCVTPVILVVAWLFARHPSRLWRDVLTAAIPTAMVLQILGVFAVSRSPAASHYLYFVIVASTLTNTTLRMSYRSARWATLTSFCLLVIALAITRRIPTPVAATQFTTFTVCAFTSLRCNLDRERDFRRSYLAQLRDRLRFAATDLEARRDALTRLGNRRQLDETSASVWSAGAVDDAPVSVVLLDIDRFKGFNDRYGHPAGDECLKRVGACVAAEVAGTKALAARYGGEEFLVLLPGADLEEALALAERVRCAIVALAIPHAGSDDGVVTASFGVASGRVSSSTPAQLTAAADAALYLSKRRGRNCISTPPASWRSVA